MTLLYIGLIVSALYSGASWGRLAMRDFSSDYHFDGEDFVTMLVMGATVFALGAIFGPIGAVAALYRTQVIPRIADKADYRSVARVIAGEDPKEKRKRKERERAEKESAQRRELEAANHRIEQLEKELLDVY